MDIREFKPQDLGWLLTLNNEAVPAVNKLTEDELLHIIGLADKTFIAEDKGLLLGAVILMREGHMAEYPSKNYAWHSNKFAQHLYVDRIIIAGDVRGKGVGKKLYQEAIRLGNSQKVPLTAEVNLIPNNPASHAFHQRLGFEVSGEIEHAPDYKVRCYKK